MNAQETITAAIEKLEGLKAASVPGPWHWWNLEAIDQGWTDNGPNLEGANGQTVLCGWGNDAWGISVAGEDADLIVTLHRTIDAQLALLKELLHIAETAGWSEEEFPSKPGHEHGLLLARSILGEAS
ncbi:hypothetical protein IT072_02605 [Leifsonia sp. ZF2019]|uniref:hypothetical protein n=1 Tax=Leifsonia sp. ZF2019 TaxID=2781978 RepID=UPI001CBD0A7E|nr:hypothetical protein [Leifsonia sp. ZF2019]UAJ79988.1 hypothetical protein IT072_02605 [Leifsonia sp. ZF2019]